MKRTALELQIHDLTSTNSMLSFIIKDHVSKQLLFSHMRKVVILPRVSQLVTTHTKKKTRSGWKTLPPFFK